MQPEWETHIEVLGATTTILVEWIQAQSIDPSGIEATLMLLGIYEDTGSLSYIGTSPRDMRACTWLLEAGANLDVAVDYLNHPLSHEQRELYDRLLTDSQTLDVNGFSIVLAPGAAMGMQDEISSIAHKLRDLFDPDGIFVLVELNDHVQLVARSTIDAVDVGRVAAHFGGGGHKRAAAALIEHKDSKRVLEELKKILPEIIEAPVTVADIMSRGPQLLEGMKAILWLIRAMLLGCSPGARWIGLCPTAWGNGPSPRSCKPAAIRSERMTRFRCFKQSWSNMVGGRSPSWTTVMRS